MPYFCGSRPLVELEPVDQAFGERAAGALGHQHVFGAQLHAPRVALGDGAVLADAHVAGRDPDDLAVRAVEHLDGREARVDLHAGGLGLAAEIARHVGERAHEVAVIAHQLGHQGIGQPHATGRAQVVETVVRHRHRQGPVVVAAPLGQQCVEPHGIDDDAGQDMAADLGALLQHHHGQVGLELLQADRGREPGRPGPHHHDVELHRLARRWLEPARRALDLRHGGSTPCWPARPVSVAAGPDRRPRIDGTAPASA